MNKNISPLTKLLLPIDINLNWNRIVELASSITSTVKNRIELVTILHVMKGRFLSQHMTNIDFRVDEILKSESFKELKQQFIDKEITPVLEKIENRFRELDGNTPVEKLVKDGKVAEQIYNTAIEGNYSTIVMERRGLSPVKEMILGSVTEDLLHRDLNVTFYLAGKELPKPGQCPVKTTIICADGSEASKAAIKEASILISARKEEVNKVLLMRVIDLASYEEQIEKGESPEKKAHEILDEAKDTMVSLGVPKNLIELKWFYGDPVEVISTEAEKNKVDMVFMGRTGRSAIADLILGSVTRGVIHHCQTPTLVITNK